MSPQVSPRPHLRLCRRWIVESPRFSHPSAVPVLKVSGRPDSSHSRYRRRSVSRLPRSLYLPAPADSFPRVAPVHVPSGFAIVESPGCPEFPPLARRWTNFLSYLKNLGPSASPIDSSPGCPGFSSPGSTSLLSRVAPRPHRRLVDDVSPAESNFASSACATDESSVSNRVTASASLTLDALSISVLPLTSRFQPINFKTETAMRVSCQVAYAVPISCRVTS